jgi:ornithine cyclodeaminase/alanine dehydrogenase
VTEAIPTLRVIRFIDISPAAMERLARETPAFFSGELLPCDNEEACLAGADVIVTCTPGDRAVVRDAWFAAGATGVGIEGGCAWEPAALRGADKFLVDDLPQARHFDTLGDFPGGLPPVYAELGDIVAGRKPGRESDRERILATPLGLAIEDVAIARLVYEAATRAEVGTRVPLMRDDL